MSVRASCRVLHSPFFASVTIFVEYSATQMSISNGIAANFVMSPIKSKVPQTISTTPTNGAMTCGQRMSILTNGPTPQESGKQKFLDSFGQEDPADKYTNQKDRLCCAIRPGCINSERHSDLSPFKTRSTHGSGGSLELLAPDRERPKSNPTAQRFEAHQQRGTDLK